MSDDGEWKTVQLVPVAPGINGEFGHPLVALLLQEDRRDSSRTRVVGGFLEGDGKVTAAWSGAEARWAGSQWARSDS